jgi:hypothetical protein
MDLIENINSKIIYLINKKTYKSKNKLFQYIYNIDLFLI